MVDENPILAGSDGESIFLVYLYVVCSLHYVRIGSHTRILSFIFTLQEFAKEMVLLVDAFERLYAAEREQAAGRNWLKRLLRVFTPQRSPRNTRTEGNLRKRICVFGDALTLHGLDTDSLNSYILHSRASPSQADILPQNYTPCSQHGADTSASSAHVYREA